MNALVKQGNALPTVGYFALPVLVHRWKGNALLTLRETLSFNTSC
jgi:hypothetical protein